LFVLGKKKKQESRPMPTPGPFDVLVRVKSVGICGMFV